MNLHVRRWRSNEHGSQASIGALAIGTVICASAQRTTYVVQVCLNLVGFTDKKTVDGLICRAKLPRLSNSATMLNMPDNRYPITRDPLPN